MTTFLVSADIEFLEGSLKGLVIPAGHSVTCGDRRSALRIWNWAAKTFRNEDFVRAAGTGNKFVFRSFPTMKTIVNREAA